MYLADYHLHTSFSSDSETPMEKMADAAYSAGMSEIAITDHIDYDYPDNENFPFMFDYQPFSEAIEKTRDMFKDKLIIRKGVEVGFQPHIAQEIASLAKNEYDFVIGSTHCVDKQDLYFGPFFSDKTKKEAYTRYFEDVLTSVKLYDFFDVYGHLDVIERYGTYEDNSLIYADYAEIIDEILKNIILKGKGIELNTSGPRYKLSHFHPQTDIVKRYRELGGEIITMGSDAHTVNNAGNMIKDAQRLLLESGFKYFTLFEKRTPKFMSLGK